MILNVPFLILILCTSCFCFSQTEWEELLPLNEVIGSSQELVGVNNSSVNFEDIDLDGDEDLLITGIANFGGASCLYENNEGYFTQITDTPFDSLSYGASAFSDIDSDGDQDVLIIGRNNDGIGVAKLYVNNGAGVFEEVVGTTITGLINSNIAFSDIDNDGDEDLLITGKNSQEERVSILYTNNGVGVFTEFSNNMIEGLVSGNVIFFDSDSDGDKDLLITGKNQFNNRLTKLYLNDGDGLFTVLEGSSFIGLLGGNGSTSYSDVDSDGDFDVVITGYNGYNYYAKLYLNNGNSQFMEDTGVSLTGVSVSAVYFEDVDMDNDEDLLITGALFNNIPSTKLYLNDGQGHFTENQSSNFVDLKYGAIGFSDVDLDGDSDVLLTGSPTSPGIPMPSVVYCNDGLGAFEIVTTKPFSGANSGDLDFSDIDNDGDEDVIITGISQINTPQSILYENDGQGNFSKLTSNIESTIDGTVSFSDIDLDGDEDVFITGSNLMNVKVAKMYINDGLGNFNQIIDVPFEGVDKSSVAFFDVDSDGDEDLLITGATQSNISIAKLYSNNGTGVFSEITGTPFIGVNFGSVAFSDIDLDGDEDAVIMGMSDSQNAVSILYTNDGQGNFIENTTNAIVGMEHGSAGFSDIDLDGDEDLLVSGRNTIGDVVSKIYTNNGIGNFTESSTNYLDSIWLGSFSFADVDLDGDEDIFMSGFDASYQAISKLYINNGQGVFQVDLSYLFEPMAFGSIGFSDFNLDGYLDVLLTGSSINHNSDAKGYINKTCADKIIVDNVIACNSYTWRDDIEYFSSNNSATDTIFNVICGVSDSIFKLNLTINSNPHVDVRTACKSFTWIDGITYTTSNNTANYSMISSTGCDSIVHLDLTINEVTTSVNYEDGIFSANASTGLYYRWLDCENDYSEIFGAVSPTFSPTENGQYAVKVTDANCTDTSICLIKGDASLNELTAELFQIYPNPSNGIFKIESTLYFSEIRVIDINGREILRTTNPEINIENQARGIYFIKLNAKGNVYTRKILLE